MNYPAPEMFDIIKQFTKDKNKQKSLEIFLSELPIGDEYGLLTDEEWNLGERFVNWCVSHGVWREVQQ